VYTINLALLYQIKVMLGFKICIKMLNVWMCLYVYLIKLFNNVPIRLCQWLQQLFEFSCSGLLQQQTQHSHNVSCNVHCCNIQYTLKYKIL